METGQVIAGKYRLNGLLGQGGMASVWSATNTFTERQFAIKFMLPSLAKTRDAVERFLQEAKVSARINHPNIIEIIDVGQAEDTSLFLVMELLTGVTLETAMRRQSPPMTLSEMAFVMVEVARALAAAHQNGVIHRDLKPSNIFLHRERDGRAVPKILDFGVSKFVEEEGGRIHARTIAGTVLGSPLYMSPEQARGDAWVDGRADIFSFGALLFEALAGFRPYDAANFNALIVKIATQPPKDIDECAPHVPQSLRNLVKECLEPNVTTRLASFDVVAARLMAALPELESVKLSIPAPASGILERDPDATNALPVVRASDRPPLQAPMFGSIPPPPGVPTGMGFGAPTASTPLPNSTAGHSLPPPPAGSSSRAGATFAGNDPASSRRGSAFPASTDQAGHQAGHQGANESPWKNPAAILMTCGIAILVIVLGLIVLFATSHSSKGTTGNGSSTTAPNGAGSAPPLTTGRAATDSTSATGASTVVRIDSLPVASQAIKMGHVSFGSEPVPCVLTVDGQPRGTTPLPQIDMTPGAHRIECKTVKGQSEVRNMTVFGGATDKHVFRF